MHSSYVTAGSRFEAARQIHQAPDHFGRLHGHSFDVIVRADSAHADNMSLQRDLQAITSAFTYQHLNSLLSQTDDISIARHIAGSMLYPVSVSLQSSPERGAIVSEDNQAWVWLNTEFEAAHQLPHVPAGHKCGRLHGHTFGVRLVAHADSCTHADLEAAWAPSFLRLNHRYLNQIDGLANPTSEVLAQWLYDQLQPALGKALGWVEVRETHSAGSQFNGHTFHIWKEQRFESAVPFDNQGNYTGHSYLIRLMLAGNIDRTMGWLLDFGDVKDRFKPIYRQLDHNPLDRLSGIRDGSHQAVVEWVHAQLSPLVPELARIDLLEQGHQGVSLMFKPAMHWPLL